MDMVENEPCPHHGTECDMDSLIDDETVLVNHFCQHLGAAVAAEDVGTDSASVGVYMHIGGVQVGDKDQSASGVFFLNSQAVAELAQRLIHVLYALPFVAQRPEFSPVTLDKAEFVEGVAEILDNVRRVFGKEGESDTPGETAL